MEIIIMQNLKTNLKRGAVALVAAGSSVAVNAADYTTQIGAAGTEANTNQAAVMGAVIALAVIGFGVTALVSWMRK